MRRNQTGYRPTRPLQRIRPLPPIRNTRRRPTRYQLRPLSTGEILDRTFTLYRARFWLYAGLASISAILTVVVGIAQRIIMDQQGVTAAARTSPAALGGRLGIVYAISTVGGLLSFLAYSITHAAISSAVFASYLGHPTSFATAWNAIKAHWLRFPLIALWQFWSATWVFFALFLPSLILLVVGATGLKVLGGFLIFLAFGSLFYGIFAYLRNTLAVPAAVMENLPVRAAMRRSKTLAAGSKGRIFLLLLLLFALYFVAGAIQAPFGFMLLAARSATHVLAEAVTLLITFLTGAVIGPVGAIGLTLFYIDERVRKEGFDIEFLMQETPAPIPSPTSDPELG